MHSSDDDAFSGPRVSRIASGLLERFSAPLVSQSAESFVFASAVMARQRRFGFSPRRIAFVLALSPEIWCSCRHAGSEFSFARGLYAPPVRQRRCSGGLCFTFVRQPRPHLTMRCSQPLAGVKPSFP